MMKKFFALLSSFALLVTMVACSNTADSTTTNANGSNRSAETADGDIFRIGAYQQLSGVNSVAGVAAKNGIHKVIRKKRSKLYNV